MTKQTFKRMAWIVGILVALTACKEKVETVEVVRAIKTITIGEQASDQILKFSGIVAAVDSSGLSFQVDGQVDSVLVDIGDPVAKDEILAVLDPEPYQLEVNAIKAELVKARGNVSKSKAQYERHKQIYEQGAGAKSYLEVAENEYKSAKSAVDFQIARLDLANRNLRKTKLAAPYEGTIAWRSVQPHEEVAAGQKVLEINATGELEVLLAIPETTIDRIHINDEATITFPTLPSETTRGRISDVGSAAVEANSFPVKVALFNPNKSIKPGMTAEAVLAMRDENQKPGFMVPLQALLPAQEKNQAYAFVYDPKTSTVKKTKVHIPGVVNKQAIIDEGLAAGDIIAVAGASFLADDMKVNLLKP